MKRIATLLIALALIAAACGDDDAAADPASLDSCEGLAVAGISMLQDTIDLIDGLDATALAAFSDGSDVPPEFVEIQQRGDELTARADEIGCSDEEMAALMAERAADLSADTAFGQFILESIKTGDGGGFLDN